MSEQDRSPPSPPWLTRRRALLLGGAGLLGVAGAGLGVRYFFARTGRSKAEPGTVRDYRVVVPAAIPRLVMARGPVPAQNVRAALERMGGMDQFVVRGDLVLIKPNIGWDRTPVQGANTDPGVVVALIQACREAGAAEVLVADSPVNDAARTFARSGISAASRQAGAQVLSPREAQARSVEIPGKLGRWSILEPFLRATKLINVPVAKHHGFTLLTAGMKNWIGAVTTDKGRLHQDVHHSILGLATLFRPTLTVVDATRVLLRNGPAGGNLNEVKQLDTIVVSLDPVAADAWAATELGFPLDRIQYLGLAERQGLGRADYRALNPVALKI